MLKSIKVRVYPTKSQEEYLGKLFGCYRKVYNMSLDFKKTKYETDGTSVKLKEIGYEFHNVWTKDEGLDYLNEHNTKVLKQSIINLLESYKNFFGGSGYPKFKSKFDKQSVRFPLESISKNNKFQDYKITLSGLKNLKFNTSEKYLKYLQKSKVMSATLSKSTSGKYFLSILVDGSNDKISKPKNTVIAGDIGIKDFLVMSNGDVYKNIKSIRNNEEVLKKLQRQISRKEKGSRNRLKARIKFARKHEDIRNKKIDYLHQITNKLLDENQVIVLENLNVKGMVKNHKLAKSIQELSIFEFKRILKYKAEWRGNIVIDIDRFFPSSKLCNNCGYKKDDLTLDIRKWTCPSCNTDLDRDLNASINIENEGVRMILEDQDLLTKLLDFINVNEGINIENKNLFSYINTNYPHLLRKNTCLQQGINAFGE